MNHEATSWTCQEVEQHTEAHLDGALANDEAAALAAHLDLCQDCRESLAAAREIATALRALPVMQCPERVMAAARDKCDAAATRKAPVRRVVRYRHAAVLLSMAATLIVVFSASLFPRSVPTPPVPTPAAPTPVALDDVSAQVAGTTVYAVEIGTRAVAEACETVLKDKLAPKLTRAFARAYDTAVDGRSIDST